MKFYMHAGSLNHGCEAIVRSTASIVDDLIEVYSEYPEEDNTVCLSEICTVTHQGHARNKRDIGFVFFKLIEMIFHSEAKYHYLYKNIIDNANKEELYVSIGGDNYCYGNNPNLMYLNRILNKKGCKTVLWGCSIEPDSLKNSELVADMKRYSLITARETLTYNALLNAGVKENTYLFPDPAFLLGKEVFDMNNISIGKGLVGINVSPLIKNKETREGIILKNYIKLLEYIINQTDLNILLIPHVCKSGNDDNILIDELFCRYQDSDRIFRINKDGKMNCKQLKYAISHCRYMVVARTHASIAAYSSMVPTLVVGYSVKAKGIAMDIFGEVEHYVVDIHSIIHEEDLQKNFLWMIENEETIKTTLKSRMPEYINNAREAGHILKRICRGENISHDMEN